jgi:hypothetical protein
MQLDVVLPKLGLMTVTNFYTQIINGMTDTEFQNDCLVFTLFNTHIQTQFGTNNWIPFTEQEVNSREKFESNFMSKFINGKLKTTTMEIYLATKLKGQRHLYFQPKRQQF